MAKISIIMSAYNHKNFVAKAIDSVLNQTFKDFEFIIFDDISSDRTWEIIKSYQDPRIKVFRAEYNRGMVLNINEAIEIASGEFIAHINSDDYWEENKLAKQLAFLEQNPEYSAVFTGANIVNEKNQIVNNDIYPYFENVTNKNPNQWLNHFLYQHNCLCFPSLLIKKECYQKIGLYKPAYIVLLDLDMWVRLCLNGYKIHIINEKLTNFRVTDKELNLSRTPSKLRSSIEESMILKLFSQIKNKEQFLSLFPNYPEPEMISEKNLDCLFLITLVEEFSKIIKNQPKNKSEKRLIKKLMILNQLAIHELFNKIALDPRLIIVLKNKFGFDFKKQLEYSKIND